MNQEKKELVDEYIKENYPELQHLCTDEDREIIASTIAFQAYELRVACRAFVEELSKPIMAIRKAVQDAFSRRN